MPKTERIRADSAIRIIEKLNTMDGVEWVTMEAIADDFKSKNTAPKGAYLPAEPGAVLENKDLELVRQQ